MTRDRARKREIRARMAASGEPYSVAARKLGATPPAGDTAVSAVIACANATLAASSARFEYRRETEVAARERPERRERPRPGPVGRLARRAARAAWDRFSPEVDAAQFGEMLAEAFRRSAGVGVAEPAASRYQIDYGGYAQAYFDGQLWGGPSGAPLRANNRVRGRGQATDLLVLLGRLRAVTQAWYRGEETLRGTPCRSVAVRAGSAAFTVWIDNQHIRQIRSEWSGRDPRHGSSTETYELWDFSVPVDSLDWSHLPSFGADR